MRIAIDAHNLWTAGGRSVGRNIVDRMVEIAPSHDYLFIVPSDVGYRAFDRSDHPNVTVATTKPGTTALGRARAWEEVTTVRRAVREFAPDLVIALGNRPVIGASARQAILVHDPHLFYPRRHYRMEPFMQRLNVEIRRMLLRRSLSKVDVVFCQTTAAAARFREAYGFDNVAAWPNAVSAAIPQDAPRSDLPGKVAPHADSFKLFALTRYYPHKNLESIVDAFERYPELMADTVCFTTIAAEHHPWAGRLLERIEGSVPDRIINLGPIDQGEVRWHFESMDALIQPTLLESHSASYLEAMAFGVPVITSDLDFARVVCGSAAEYLDPHDPKSLAQAVAKLRDDPQLRNRLVTAGRERLGELGRTWDEGIAAALDTLGVPYP